MALKHAEPDEVANLRRPGPMLATSKTVLLLATGSMTCRQHPCGGYPAHVRSRILVAEEGGPDAFDANVRPCAWR